MSGVRVPVVRLHGGGWFTGDRTLAPHSRPHESPDRNVRRATLEVTR